MLERITDFLSHPDLIFGYVSPLQLTSHVLSILFLQNNSVSQQEDPTERFIQVLRYYLAGWHIKPKGVKKPYDFTQSTLIYLIPHVTHE